MGVANEHEKVHRYTHLTNGEMSHVQANDGIDSNSDERKSPTGEITEAVKNVVSYGGRRISPKAIYQRMEVFPEAEGEGYRNDQHSIRSSMSSVNSGLKRFQCQFDPGAKNGRLLLLMFDITGMGTFQEMSRLELLRLTQDAAKPMTPDADAIDEEADQVRKSLKTGSMRIRRSSSRRLQAEPVDNYGSIVDVQRVHARDIRKLDNAFSVSNEPSIVVRKQAILLNADPLRAIIMREMCLVFVPDGADSLLSILKEKFLEATHNDYAPEVPYEFKALEALLATLCRCFELEFEKTYPIISSTLDRLASGKTSASELETLRVFKNTMNEFESQVDGIRRALMEILDNEEDLRLLYLTKLHEDPSLLSDLWSFDSEEAEVLMENYLQDIFSTRTKANLMQHRIQNTESLVMLKLDSMRNYLLGVDLIFSLVVISLAIGTYITGVFGMNLNSHLQEAEGWFWSVFAFTLFVFITLTVVGFLFFRNKGVFL